MRRLGFWSAVLLALSPSTAFAERFYLLPEGLCDGGIATGKISFDCIPLVVAYAIQLVFGLIGTMSLLQIIWSGYQYALRGVTGSTDGGKQRLQAALLGLVVSILAFVIVDFIVSTIAT